MTNKEILEKANSAIAKGDYEDFLTFCADDVIWILSEIRLYMEKKKSGSIW